MGENPDASRDQEKERTAMIVRVLRGRVPADRAQAFRSWARQTLRDVRTRDGNICAHLARQAAPGGEVVVFTTVWRDLPSIYAWLGGRSLLVSPMTGPRNETMLIDVDIQHYEGMDEETAVDPSAGRVYLTSA